MNKLILIFSIILLASCSQDKSYTYTELKKNNISGKYEESTPKSIKASNDSVAYCLAFNEFAMSYISIEWTNQKAASRGISAGLNYPEKFSLTTEDGKDISSGDFLTNKEQIQDSIISKIRSTQQKLNNSK